MKKKQNIFGQWVPDTLAKAKKSKNNTPKQQAKAVAIDDMAKLGLNVGVLLLGFS